MFHLFPSLLVRPSSAGFLPHLLLAVVGRRCHQVKVVALAVSTLFPRCCRHAMFFLVRFGCSCHPYTVSLATSILARRKPGSL
ncbi:hypothetical protein GQ42DRAFT_162551 [Ramicandelaber brevisporus]|nr:hypothetical protein GQ42DRAFT_162551 [Ramicandelaber brevisporus]